MNVQTFQGIRVVHRPYTEQDEHRGCCIPNGYGGHGQCVFYEGTRVTVRVPCPPEAADFGACCMGGTYIKAEDEQAQDSTIPSMVAP